MSPARWCPTPEQVMILEEIYRNGLKTPNATQIQHITCHLSLYGKIEGKNVFYWFQNHKARDRQKLRRKIYKQLQLQHHQFLLKHCRFDHHPCFLQHTHNQNLNDQCPHPLLPLSTGSYFQMEGQEGSTTKETSCERMWFGGVDETPVGAENGNGDAETTGSLKTLELFPVKGSCVKEEERESGNGGWGGHY